MIKLKTNENKTLSNKAITLISLIITIIILLILSGVIINMVMGENGIINKAQFAKERTNAAQEQEQYKMLELENTLNNAREETNIDKDEYEDITSGEAFLIMAGKCGYSLKHEYVYSYTAIFFIEDLDFSNIKEFEYNYTLNTNNSASQQVKISNDLCVFLDLKGAGTGKVSVNGATNVRYDNFVSYQATGVFKITSYTTMDGRTRTF